MIRISKNYVETEKTLDIAKLTYNQFMGNIQLNYLDTFLSKEIIILGKGQKFKIDWLSFSIYRSDGKSDRNNSTTNRMSQNKEIIAFLKKAPINSYIVIDEILFYNGKRKKKKTTKSVAWKIVNNN